jgi:hypothetical protein
MDWILSKTKKMNFHTDLSVILKPIQGHINDFNWLISDLDFMASKTIPLNFDDEYFLLSGEDLLSILNMHVQFIWAVIIAIPKDVKVDELIEDDIPYSEGNELIWKNGNIQHPEGKIEIVCFDSSYTIIKFADKYLSDKFKSFFGNEAIELEIFSSKFIL